MKRALVALIAVIYLFIVLLTQAKAFNLGIGATVWYAWWNPAFSDYLKDKNNFFLPKIKTSFEMNPAPLYGPVIILRFNEKVSWNTALYLGRYTAKTATLGISNLGGSNSGLIVPDRGSFTSWKYDLDSSVNIKLFDFLSIFPGIKYQHYSYSRSSVMIISAPMKSTAKIIHNGIGCGLGLSFNVRLVDNLFLFINQSGLYQFAMQSSKTESTIFGHIPYVIKSPPQMINSHGWGGNTTLTLAYYIVPASTTISLGARYQVIYYLDKSMNANNFQMIEGKHDHFYGITLTAVYTFSFTKNRDPERG